MADVRVHALRSRRKAMMEMLAEGVVAQRCEQLFGRKLSPTNSGLTVAELAARAERAVPKARTQSVILLQVSRV
jgi:hypothetical protein